jgi:tRNA pseudouridine38-40 synthase
VDCTQLTHLALGLEYDGRSYSGFQRQLGVPTVQAELEQALSQIADAPIVIACAGRTDAGVHATGQVVGFSTSATRQLKAWRRGVNSLTSAALKIRWVSEVAADFHPRFSATARRYMYIWYEDTVDSPVVQRLAVRSNNLDDKRMHAAAQGLVGDHDFTSYRGAGCQSRSARRLVEHIAVERFGDLVVLDVTANAFLLHMVRNIAGALVQVGLLQQPVDWPAALLPQRDRRLLGPTAPPHGLYLIAVRYPNDPFPVGPVPGLLRGVRTRTRA